MKKLSFMVLMMASAFLTKAQMYIQGGLNLANITKTANGETQDNNNLATFNVGFMSRFGISSVFDLESGLLLTGRGSRADTYFNGGNDYVRTKFNPIYLELPLNAVVKIPIAKGTGLFFNAGPYIAVGIGGKSKMETKVGSLVSTSSSDIKFSNDDPFTSEQDDAAYDKLKRFDYGINVGGGLDLGHFLVKLNYGFGLAKINSTESNNSSDNKNKYRTMSVSLGIPLGR